MNNTKLHELGGGFEELEELNQAILGPAIVRIAIQGRSQETDVAAPTFISMARCFFQQDRPCPYICIVHAVENELKAMGKREH